MHGNTKLRALKYSALQLKHNLTAHSRPRDANLEKSGYHTINIKFMFLTTRKNF